MTRAAWTIAAVTLASLMTLPSFADDPPAADAPPAASPPETNSAATGDTSSGDRETRLAAYLTGATFTGNFTSDGKEDRAPKPESYVIDSCRYDAETGKYELAVQIKYGKTDGLFPIVLDVMWAGQTPVITLDSVWIPGLGTFSSRVLIRNGRYAGTWQHDAKGGHLFGKITPKM